MKKLILLNFLFLICITSEMIGREISLQLINSGETCQFGPKLWFFDNDDNGKFELFLYGGCPNNAKLFNLTDNSMSMITNCEKAYFISGDFFNNDFIIYIIDSISSKYTHKLYYDGQISKAVLEDYSDNGSEPGTIDDADNYFFTQRIGSLFLITKKAEINVQSVLLCSLDGKIITQLQNVEGWGQFVFDLSEQPSGMYLIQFTATDKVLTKKLVWVR